MESIYTKLYSSYRDTDDVTNGGPRCIHVVAIPYPAHGHIVPLMQFCERLAKSLNNIIITFVNTEHNHGRLVESLNGRNVRLNPNVRLVGIPGGLPPELHGHPDSVKAAFQASEALSTPFQNLLDSLNSNAPPVTHIISDVLMSWTQACADELHIPRIAFWTSCAAVYYVIWYIFDLISKGKNPTLKVYTKTFEDNNTEMVSNIPGLPPMDLNDLPIIVRSDPADFIYQFLMRQLTPMKKAACILINTVEELESNCLAELTGSVPVHAIGPLHCADAGGGGGIFKEDVTCLKWLDTQAPKSVLYISFGSIFRMDVAQVKELSEGLRASGQPFLWAMRRGFVETGGVGDAAEEEENLVAWILDRTEGRGIITTWAPQLQVLRHVATGGFLTHCGWNSVMESVACGVPMLCWPDVGERRTNGRLVVSMWKVGLEFGRSKADGTVSRREVERVIRRLFDADSPVGVDGDGPANSLRSRAVALQLASRQASSRSWDALLGEYFSEY